MRTFTLYRALLTFEMYDKIFNMLHMVSCKVYYTCFLGVIQLLRAEAQILQIFLIVLNIVIDI